MSRLIEDEQLSHCGDNPAARAKEVLLCGQNTMRVEQSFVSGCRFQRRAADRKAGGDVCQESDGAGPMQR